MAFLGESGLQTVQKVDLTGYLLVFLSSIFCSLVMVFARKHLMQYDAWQLTSVRFYSSAAFLLPLALIMPGFNLSAVTWQGYILWIILALVFCAWFYAQLPRAASIWRFGHIIIRLCYPRLRLPWAECC